MDRYQGTDTTPVYALCGKLVPGGHGQKPTWPQPVHWLDWPRGLLPLEGGPARPTPCRPQPPRAADA